MTKDEFEKTLREHGYDAETEDGCVMVTHENKRVWKEISKIAKKEGYDKSYGWRPHKNT